MTHSPIKPSRPWGAAHATLDAGSGVTIDLTAAGDVAGVGAAGERSVSAHRVGPHNASLANVYLRKTTSRGIEHTPLTGSQAPASFECAGAAGIWRGEALGANWTVRLAPDEQVAAVVWRVEVEPHVQDDAVWELVVLQDLALAPAQAAQSSESYVSHYVAHRLVEHDAWGKVVMSRQTMSVAPAMPLFALVIAEGAAHAGTDAMDLYTPTARGGATPAFLTEAPWPDRVRQHEAATAALMSAPRASSEVLRWHAVALYWPDVRGYMEAQLEGIEAIVAEVVERSDAALHGEPADAAQHGDSPSLLATAPSLSADPLDDAELLALVDGARFIERDDQGRVLSAFGVDGTHVVSGGKNAQLVRPHGHVMIAGASLSPDEPSLSTTVFEHGVFGSHTVYGNTSFDRLVSVHRHHLNLVRSNGVRVLVHVDGEWRLLAQPSAFVLDVGRARWIYAFADLRVEVTTLASADGAAIVTDITASRPVDLRATVDLDLAGGAWSARRDSDALVVTADADTQPGTHHPGLAYVLAANEGTALADDGALFDDGLPRGTTMVTASAREADHVRLAFTADGMAGETALPLARSLATSGLDGDRAAQGHREVLGALTRGLEIEDASRFSELATLLMWWANDARVHYLVPHGLEQYSGAAWGTRDVCQGPFELLLAAGRFAACRDILLRVFAVQSVEGTFPQWFMFDDYAEVLQEHSHGDVVWWPLFALGQYLQATSDASVLDETVTFRDGEPASLLRHLEALAGHVESSTIAGTSLPVYGDGDWDDTLQPARPGMRAHMASTWTSALAYQASRLIGAHLSAPAAKAVAERFDALADRLGDDILTHMVPGGVSAGFVDFSSGAAAPMIHPYDHTTGLTYRLIPMTQLILAGLLDPEAADRHVGLIREHLLFPDGVRLTDRPSQFRDGETTFFLRAEQAAFFGREVGLMYAHAHIRWAEALDAMGSADLGDELLRLSPIGMRERVPSASLRQRTCYTSSSDADFPSRYVAERDFDLLRTGQVRTVDGWRVYSSGPGIYIRQVLQSLLGMKETAHAVQFEPTLSPQDDGLEIRLVIAGTHRRVVYHVDPSATSVTVSSGGIDLPVTPVPHTYRWPGAMVSLEHLRGAGDLEIRTPAGVSSTPLSKAS